MNAKSKRRRHPALCNQHRVAQDPRLLLFDSSSASKGVFKVPVQDRREKRQRKKIWQSFGLVGRRGLDQAGAQCEPAAVYGNVFIATSSRGCLLHDIVNLYKMIGGKSTAGTKLKSTSGWDEEKKWNRCVWLWPFCAEANAKKHPAGCFLNF